MATLKDRAGQSAAVIARRKKFGVECKDKNLAKQEHKDSTDLNRLLDAKKRGAALSHLENFQGMYGDFSDMTERNFEDMQNQIANAITIFNDLPAELRQNEFGNKPGRFFEFVNNPENADKLDEIFPQLARPGLQFPDVIGGGSPLSEAVATAVRQGVVEGLQTPSEAVSGDSESGGETPA